MLETRTITHELKLSWCITASAASMLILYLVLAYGYGQQLHATFAITEDQRLILRTIFYGVAIIMLPMTNLIRFIQIRLNQTMPGPASAKQRYQITILVSMCLLDSVGLLGLLIFALGDGYNTLIILVGIASLGVFLYRPKASELLSIAEALTAAKTQ